MPILMHVIKLNVNKQCYFLWTALDSVMGGTAKLFFLLQTACTGFPLHYLSDFSRWYTASPRLGQGHLNLYSCLYFALVHWNRRYRPKSWFKFGEQPLSADTCVEEGWRLPRYEKEVLHFFEPGVVNGDVWGKHFMANNLNLWRGCSVWEWFYITEGSAVLGAGT